jgi:putative hydrolase of the HAD superfamily
MRRLFHAMPTWIFDLDNTLHDAEPYIFPTMNRLMTAYVAQHLGVDEVEADAIRLAYWQQHGSTLAGLRRHSPSIDPEHFLRETHRFPDLARELRPIRGLRNALRRLPGKKVLFTNAPLDYATEILRALKVSHAFDGIMAIQHTGLHPKPHPNGYRQILQRYRLDATRCIMVEDTMANLITARQLGMRTVLIASKPRKASHADITINSLSRLHQACAAQGWLSARRVADTDRAWQSQP